MKKTLLLYFTYSIMILLGLWMTYVYVNLNGNISIRNLALDNYVWLSTGIFHLATGILFLYFTYNENNKH